MVTPFAVIGSATAVLLALDPPRPAVALAVAAAILYVDGHGIHLSANEISRKPLAGEASEVTHFWDEEFGHIEWHLGWFGLMGSFCLAERRASGPVEWQLRAATAVVLGFTVFTNTVEGATWWMTLAAVPVFAAWAIRRPRPLVVTAAAAFVIASVLIAIWAIWHRGMPQFSDLYWL